MAFEKVRGVLDWLERVKLLYDLFAAVVEWKTVKTLLEHVTHIPSDIASAIAWIGAAALILGLHRFAYRKQGSNQLTAAASAALSAPTEEFSIQSFLKGNYQSDMTAEMEAKVTGWVNKIPEGDRDRTFIEFATQGMIAYLHDETWWTIYKSQIWTLDGLNVNGAMRKEKIKELYYDPVAEKYPDFYKTRSFETWLGYLHERTLILNLPGDVVGITLRGKDFLKHVVHYGYAVSSRAL